MAGLAGLHFTVVFPGLKGYLDFPEMVRPVLEPLTLRSNVQHANHYMYNNSHAPKHYGKEFTHLPYSEDFGSCIKSHSHHSSDSCIHTYSVFND